MRRLSAQNLGVLFTGTVFGCGWLIRTLVCEILLLPPSCCSKLPLLYIWRSNSLFCFLVVMWIKHRALRMPSRQVHSHWAGLQPQPFLSAFSKSTPIQMAPMPHGMVYPEPKDHCMQRAKAGLQFGVTTYGLVRQMSHKPRVHGKTQGTSVVLVGSTAHSRQAAHSSWRCFLCCSLCSRRNWERSRRGHICTDRFVLRCAAVGC